MLKYLFLVSLLFLVGCSSSIYVDEGKSYFEYIVEDGKAFSYSGSATLGVGDVGYFMGCTDSLETNFKNFEVVSSGTPVLIQLYENPTLNNNGTLVTTYNINRNSNNTPTLLVYAGTNVSSDGTLLFQSVILGTENKAVGLFDEDLNWVLKNDECYLFKITNNDNSNIDIYSTFVWFEE